MTLPKNIHHAKKGGGGDASFFDSDFSVLIRLSCLRSR
jgi:hypothetical protein